LQTNIESKKDSVAEDCKAALRIYHPLSSLKENTVKSTANIDQDKLPTSMSKAKNRPEDKDASSNSTTNNEGLLSILNLLGVAVLFIVITGIIYISYERYKKHNRSKKSYTIVVNKE